MNITQLKKLIRQGESETLEFKKTTANLSVAMETVCAFLNSKHGGMVLVGIKDDGSIIGQDIHDKNRQELAAELKRIEPFIAINVAYITLDTDKIVIAISVNPGPRAPYSYDGRSFIRIQSTTSRMTHEQYEFIYHKNNPYRWESLTNNSYKISDLDQKRIKEIVRMAVDHGKISPAAIKSSIPDILKHLNLMVDEKLTNAAVILFGKEEKELIQSNLKLARFNGIDKSSFFDNKFLKANAFDLYDKAIDFLHFHLPVAAHIEEGKSERVETPAIPYKVLREAVTNALIHRDYSHAGGSMSIARYDDRVEINNTGSLLDGLSINQLGKEHESILRNPLIANIFFICGKTERWARGTIEMIENCKKAGNPLPIYKEIGNNFSVTLPLREPTISVIFEKQEHKLMPKLTDRQKEIIDILQHGPLNRHKIMAKMHEQLTDRTMQRELTKLKNNKTIRSEGLANATIWYLI